MLVMCIKIVFVSRIMRNIKINIVGETEGFFFNIKASATYVVGSKSFRSDIQKPRQMENAVRDI